MVCNNCGSHPTSAMAYQVKANDEGSFAKCYYKHSAPMMVSQFQQGATTRHYPFAWGDICMDPMGTMLHGNTTTIKINRQVDLVTHVYWHFTLKAWAIGATYLAAYDVSDPANGLAYCNGVGAASVKKAQLKVGGTVLDTLDETRIWIHEQFFVPVGLQAREMIGRYDNYLQQMEGALYDHDVRVPLRFGLGGGKHAHAIPLLATFRHPVEVTICTRAITELTHCTGTAQTAYLAGIANPADVNGALPNGGGTTYNQIYDPSLHLFGAILSNAERAMFKPLREYRFQGWDENPTNMDFSSSVSTLKEMITINGPICGAFIVPRLTARRDLGTYAFEYFDFGGPTDTMPGGITKVLPWLASFTFSMNGQERVSVPEKVLTEQIPSITCMHSPRNGIGFWSAGPIARDLGGYLDGATVDHQQAIVAVDQTISAADGNVTIYWLRGRYAINHEGVMELMI